MRTTFQYSFPAKPSWQNYNNFQRIQTPWIGALEKAGQVLKVMGTVGGILAYLFICLTIGFGGVDMLLKFLFTGYGLVINLGIAITIAAGRYIYNREIAVQYRAYSAQWGTRDEAYMKWLWKEEDPELGEIIISPSLRISINYKLRHIAVSVLRNGSWSSAEDFPGAHWAEVRDYSVARFNEFEAEQRSKLQATELLEA